MKAHTKSRPIQNDYLKRLEGVVSPAFREKTIVIVGLGAGSLAAEKLARMMPRAMRLCDFDTVEYANLSRTVYTFEDAKQKRPKALALAERIQAVNPFVEITPCTENFTEMPPDALDALVGGADLLIAGTDYFPAQAKVNTLSLRHGIPAVFVGIHANAEGGRIVWTMPGETCCYRCATPRRYKAQEEGQEEALNLQGGLGSIWDCQFIDTIAHKVAVSILEREQDSQLGQFYKHMDGRNEIMVRMAPEYNWGKQLWDAFLSDLPTEPKPFARELKEQALFAMDTIWMKAHKNALCPECGAKQNNQ